MIGPISKIPLRKNSSTSLDSLNFVVVRNEPHSGGARSSFYERAKDYWLSFWRHVLSVNGASESVSEHEFQHAEIVGVLTTDEGEIAAMLLHSVIDLALPRENSYYLSGETGAIFLNDARAKKFKRAMTVEFLTVDENWRKARVGLSLGKVMFGLAVRLQREIGVDTSLFRAREDLRVNESAMEYGGRVLKANVDMYRTPVSLISLATVDVVRHPSSEVEAVSEKLWAHREYISSAQPLEHDFDLIA